MLADIEADALVLVPGAQRHDDADELQQDEAHDAAVDDRRSDGRGLDAELRRVAEEQAVGDAVQRLLREDAGQQRADGAADAVRGDDVERVVERGPGAPQQAEVARERRRWRRARSRSSGRRSRRPA